MADPASKSPREIAAELALAAVGAVVLTAERVEALADEIAARGSLTKEEARGLLRERVESWRTEAARLGERTGSALGSVIGELGLVRREELDDLELHVAQLEHRLRLLEDGTSKS
jgi:polyhydroxyalkanoate synthesis regulator phasin